MIFWNDPRVDLLIARLDIERRDYLLAALERARAVLPSDPTLGEFVGSGNACASRSLPIQGLDLQLVYRQLDPGVVQLRVDMPRQPIRFHNEVELSERTRSLVDGPEARLTATSKLLDDELPTMRRQLAIGTVDERDVNRFALERESTYVAVHERAVRDRDRGIDTSTHAIAKLTRHLPDPEEAQLHVHIARLVDGVAVEKVNEIYVAQTLRRIADRDLARSRDMGHDIPR